MEIYEQFMLKGDTLTHLNRAKTPYCRQKQGSKGSRNDKQMQAKRSPKATPKSLKSLKNNHKMHIKFHVEK